MITTTSDLPTVPIGANQWVRAKADLSAFEAATIYDQPDWSITNSSDLGYIKNKPSITASKRTESYFSTTDGSGNYTVTYPTAYSAVPNVQPQLQAPSNTQLVKITASTTTGFTVNVQNRSDVIGLLPTYAAVSGASVGVLVVER